MAAFLLASEINIPIYKYMTRTELEELRDIRAKALLQNSLKITIPKVVERKERLKKRKNNRIFIVHGRDVKAAKELKDLLTGFDLKPTILSEQASGGSRTIMEKFEKYKNVGFTFVLLTPDDVGYCQKDVERLFATPKNRHPRLPEIPTLIKEAPHSELLLDNLSQFFAVINERARQNVILELGYFMGFLGRSKVCCLCKGNIEEPSDIHGIIYIPYKKSVKEAKRQIIKELKAAKYTLKENSP